MQGAQNLWFSLAVLFFVGVMVKSYNEAGSLFLKINDKPSYRAPSLSEKPKLTSSACGDKEYALSGGVDVMQIMSLPDELYDKEKSSMFFSLKEAHKKPFLSGDALRLVVSRSARMKDLERVVFGKALTPEERLSSYKINIKSLRDVVAVQQISSGVQGDAADKNISNFLAAGNLMIFVLQVLMDVAQKSESLLRYNVEALSLLGDNDGELQEAVSSIQAAVDWLTSFRGANYVYKAKFNPTLNSVKTYAYKRLKGSKLQNTLKTNKNIGLDACRALRSASPEDCYKYMITHDYDANSSLIGFREHLTWITRLENGVSTEKDRENVNIKTKTSDEQAADSSVQHLLNITQGVRKDLANFGK